MSTIVTRAAALAAVTALAAVMVSAPAQAEPGEKPPDLSDVGDVVDKAVTEQMDDGAVPGAAVSIVSGGEVIHSKAYGYADLASKTKVDTATTGFYTASTAKLFTAASVLQLEAKGKLDLDTDVNEYLDFDIPDAYPGKPITLEHLLTHTSGFDPDYGMVGMGVTDPEELPSLRDSLLRQPERVEPPGALIAYDNYGIALAGYIVERVSGVPYDEYVNEHVYDALDMTGSTATQPHPGEIAGNLATGYRPDGDGGQTITTGNYSAWTPTGPGQVVTTADMSKFMIDQLADESVLGEDIPKTLMTQHYTQHEAMPGMGYIYEERPRNGETLWFKGGDSTGFHNHMVLLPERDLGIYFTVNGDGNEEFDLSAVSGAVMDAYFPPGEIDKPQAIDDSDVGEYEGVYQASRISRHGILKLRALIQSRVMVTANSDGTLTTTDKTLSSKDDVDSQRWVQIEPGLFQEENGASTIAFADGILSQPLSQNQVYIKQSWYDSPVLHQYFAIGALLVLAVGVVWLPLLALRRRDNPRGAKLSRLLAWLTSVTAIATTVALLSLMSNRDAAVEALILGSPTVYAIMIAASVSVVGATGMVISAITAWLRGWWRTSGRLAYSLLAAAAVTFAAFAITYNLTGPPFD